jgi:hypothetical protein
MKISLIPSDSVAVIDGEARLISFAGIDPAIHAVQFDDVAGVGVIEIAQQSADKVKFSTPIPLKNNADFQAQFQVFVSRWIAAALPPPVPSPPDTITPALKAALIVAEADATITANIKAVFTALKNKLTP